MRLVATTMREIRDPATGELRDGLDRNWARFLSACGLAPLCLPNDPAAARTAVERARPAGVLLTGGGDVSAVSGRPSARDEVEEWLLAWAEARDLPVLGVCRGFQKLISVHGGRLSHGSGHVALRHSVEGRSGAREVNSFHDYVVPAVPEGFVAEAWAPDGSVERARHERRRIQGVMWHPEREDPFDGSDVELFKDWFSGGKP
jgi:putative glutamine amidotransferase